MKENRLMADPFRHPQSRDFGCVLKCKNSKCTFHAYGEQCSCPASVTIDENGHCDLYKDLKKYTG